ncbi:hypothetical protein CLOP_g22195 [Closterium sp. NIES-67]|nr:hypothetical protein CLOP_g22195 [Closterium sp. NIES-67]
MQSPSATRPVTRLLPLAFLLPLLLTATPAASHVSQSRDSSTGWEGGLWLPHPGGVTNDPAIQVPPNGVTRGGFHGRRALLQASAPASEPPLADTADPSSSAPASSAALAPSSAFPSAPPSASPSDSPTASPSDSPTASPSASPPASPSAPSAPPSSPSPGGVSSGTPLETPATPAPPSGAGGGNAGGGAGNVGDGGATFDMPGPVCEGQCCSNAAPEIPDGMPMMTSSWLSSQLAHGAKIHVRHQCCGFWWRAADGKTWNGSVATSSDFSQPDVSQALTVIRVSATTIKLQTPSSTFLCKAPPSPPNATYPRGVLATTAEATDPLTTFTVIPIPGSRRGGNSSTDAAAAGTGANSSTGSSSNSSSSSSSSDYLGLIALASADGYYLSMGEVAPEFLDVVTEGDTAAGAGDEEWLDVREVMTVPAVRGVNLGGWLVGEQWMNPKAFAYMPWGDGTRVTFQSTTTDLYISAVSTGTEATLACNAPAVTVLQYFQLLTVPGAAENVRQVVGQMGQYWGVYTGSTTVWTKDNEPQGSSSGFTLLLLGAELNRATPMNDSLRVMIRAPNGQLLQAHEDGTITADYSADATNATLWSGPAVFFMDLINSVQGDWQAASTAGPDAAESLFDSVHSKLITELEWQDMRGKGVNTVRIPTPYWIALEDPSFAFSSPPASPAANNSSSSSNTSSTPAGAPELPYPSGALAYLDWAFDMAAKYGLRIWLSVHVAPGSQIGEAFSRDGLIRWSGLNVDRTLDFVRWIGTRFGGNPSLFGVGLLHEPVAPSYYGVLGVDGDELREYYRKAHDLIRERCACCFVSIEGRVGKSMWDVAFHMLDTWHPNVLYETHLYNVLSGIPVATRKLPQLAELEIGEEKSNKATLLDGAQSIGRPILVGEFGVAMASLTAQSSSRRTSLSLRCRRWGTRRRGGSSGPGNSMLQARPNGNFR